MNDYIHNIVSRQAESAMNIQPRLKGLFETSYQDPFFLPGTEQGPFVSEASVQMTDHPALHFDDTIPTQPSIEEPVKAFLFDHTGRQSLENTATVTPEKNEIVKEGYYPVMPLINEMGSTQENSSPKRDPAKDAESPVENNTSLVANKEFHHELISLLVRESESNNETTLVIKPGDIDTLKSNSGKKAGQIIFPPVQPVLRSAGNAVEAILNYHEGSSVIKVSIGRIEVKAISSETKTAKGRVEKTSRPTMSLDDYLKQRNIAE